MPQKILKSTLTGSLKDQVATEAVLSLPLEQAVSIKKVNALFDPFGDLLSARKPIAVAVSGGADSMALSLLLAEWAENNQRKIIALTVDHGLRENSAEEALTVANWLKKYGIRHKILSWDGEKPSTGIQTAARNKRYGLMTRWCRENKFKILMTAHHLEDQVETFLLRTECGSGLNGLASMSYVTDFRGVTLIRPLLNVSRGLLRAFLLEKKQIWIEDPSNNNLIFQRTRVRQTILKLEGRGLLPGQIFKLIGHFADLRQQLSDIVKVFFERAVRILPESYCIVHFEVLKHLPDPILERVLTQIIFELSGKFYPPRSRRLRNSVRNIKSINLSNFTLGGCVFAFRKSMMIVCRDQRSISTKQVVSGDNFNWDGLFNVVISGPTGLTGTLSGLGKKGWIEIVAKCPELKNIPIPHVVRYTLPTLFLHNEVLEVPDLKYRCYRMKKLALSIKITPA